MTCPTITTLHAILAAYDAPAGPSKADTLKAVAECLSGACAPAVPADVLAAVDRMCLPLHESRLGGATAAADARCMAAIKGFIDSLNPSCATLKQQLAAEAATGAAYVGELRAMGQSAPALTESQIKKTRSLTLDYAAMHFDAKNGKMVNSAYMVEYLNGLKDLPLDASVITGQPVAAQGEQDALLAALEGEHAACDWLMARLIALDPFFKPTASPAWPAIAAGGAAILAAKGGAV